MQVEKYQLVNRIAIGNGYYDNKSKYKVVRIVTTVEEILMGVSHKVVIKTYKQAELRVTRLKDNEESYEWVDIYTDNGEEYILVGFFRRIKALEMVEVF